MGSPAVTPNATNEIDQSNLFSSMVPHAGCAVPLCDPETPIFTAPAGTPVRFRIVHPAGHPRQHAFSLVGHGWGYAPQGSGPLDTMYSGPIVGTYSGIGPRRHFNASTVAGGANHLAGDYLFRTHESFQINGGLWGIFRVTQKH